MKIEEIRKRLSTLEQLKKKHAELPKIDFTTNTGVAHSLLNERIEQQVRLIESHAIHDELHLLSLIDRYKKEKREMVHLMISKGIVSTEDYMNTIATIEDKEEAPE